MSLVKVSSLTVNCSALVHTTVKYIADHKSEDAMYTIEQLHHTLEACCLVSVSERHSHLSFSLLSPTVESVMHGPSDHPYLLLFEYKRNNKHQVNLQI